MVRNGKNGGLHLTQIAYYKRTGEYHPSTLTSERSGIRRAAKKFVFKEKKLFYVGKDRKQMRLVIVTEEEKKKVLAECHENETGVHHGISRTLTLVESSFYWTSVTNDVKEWVHACQQCQLTRNTNIVAPTLHTIELEDPWILTNIELIGPFHATCRSNMYAILVTDLFTKWAVILPLHDVSAHEVAKSLVNMFFLYGPPRKMMLDQEKEFIQQVNRDVFGLFGIKQVVTSYSPTDDQTERTSKIIKAFLLKFCTDHPSDWDDHLSAVAYAFNSVTMESATTTPFFQMFHRTPYVPETSIVLPEAKGERTCRFLEILDAVKQADKFTEEIIASGCQVVGSIPVEQQEKSKILKRKRKHLNPFLLKVGHEVLRQRKNWWKDGRFQSEWVGPCIIDYITGNGCAILRDATGVRLKRPIKMSHLKPYVRGSIEQDGHYLSQGTIVADHDYIGLCESSTGSCQQEILTDEEGNISQANCQQSTPCQDVERQSESSKPSGTVGDHRLQPVILNTDKWVQACWTSQIEIDGT
ncbi:gypsy retrotransposon integrase-like protein 1 [Rhinatrema bivittatum]|uniref:gypsy retrotransposon integrase-like protein 1 n=1 Tax=Rhinatrema bivittatum TaxID=194408 RepID=UPI001128B590|nr:gypsy retrotransposon integrase-like protein 1 [Rhinatrema bivittatum]XP_029428492.1 gypsy retrotransposon integrase-like protein 1 [Rhinatrema bivittatum]